MAVDAVLRADELVTVMAIDAVVAELAVKIVEAINA